MIGSMVSTRPSVRRSAPPATFATVGGSWIVRPMPWPVSSWQTLNPRRSTSCCTAAPMSPVRAPATAAFMPACSPECAAATSRWVRGAMAPTGTETQASA